MGSFRETPVDAANGAVTVSSGNRTWEIDVEDETVNSGIVATVKWSTGTETIEVVIGAESCSTGNGALESELPGAAARGAAAVSSGKGTLTWQVEQ